MRPIKNTLQPVLTEAFSGLVWKVMVHSSGVLAVETRNKDLKRVVFSAFNYITGETYFKDQAYEETWNLSLAYAGEHNLVLIGYGHTETPESKGILSVNIKDGSILWEKFNISLNQVQDEGLQVFDSRIHPKKYSWINHTSAIEISEPLLACLNSDIVFPEIDNNFVMPAFIEPGVLAGELNVLYHADKVFLSFHEKDSDYFKQRLVVYQQDKILIDDILISGIQKLQPETFFIQQNHLFYIRDKKEIVTYLV